MSVFKTRCFSQKIGILGSQGGSKVTPLGGFGYRNCFHGNERTMRCSRRSTCESRNNSDCPPQERSKNTLREKKSNPSELEYILRESQINFKEKNAEKLQDLNE